ncbi:MAG: dihydrofolate reductase [Pararhodobacter sp.]|nr:dihydrofolate reductase [Pararhodobacter sp.]
MVSGHVFIATSLDGFIAREDGDIGWLVERDDPTEDHGYDAFILDIDMIVMGRGTYDSMRDVRPWHYTRPVLVLSASLTDEQLPDDLLGKVHFTNKSPQDTMAMLEAQGIRRVYVDGGRVIQSFLRAGLISDMVITRVPILLGQGRSLFGTLSSDISLIHEHTRGYTSGLVQSRYRVAT